MKPHTIHYGPPFQGLALSRWSHPSCFFIVIKFYSNSTISSKCNCGLRRKNNYGKLEIQRDRAIQRHLNCPISVNQSAPKLDFEVILTMELFL